MSENPSGLRSQVSGLASPPSARLLEHFRASKQRLPLHPLEKAVLTVVALHLCFLPWALGTMHAWSQLTSLGFSILGLGLALVPRNYPSEFSGGPAMRLTMWPRLMHFPIFWIGLALLAYLAVQAFNPSWVWERNATTWWLRRVTDIPWLPTSIDTPFERFNIWRQFIIYASAWLTACTIWTGFTRRRSLQILLSIIAVNAVVLIGIGFERRITVPWNPEFKLPNFNFVLWIEHPFPGAYSFASFIYKNHAGAYLALLAGVAVSLAVYHHERSLRNMARSTPSLMWLFGGIAMACGVFFTYSRGATLLLAGYSLVSIAIFLLIRLVSQTRSTTTPAVWILSTALLTGVVGFGASQLNYKEAETKFASLFEKQAQDLAVAQRLDAYAAARSMLADSWQRGVGAGGFRYLFPEYIKHHPNSYRNGQLFWEHAHSDWLQVPIEMGVGGAALIFSGGIWIAWALCRIKVWLHPAMLLLVMGCLQIPAQAVFDFPFQSPAILATWLALLVLALRWMELESV